MADGMKNNSLLPVAGSLLFAGLFLSVCGFAEELADPTRPPASTPAAQGAAVEKTMSLQSVIIAKNRRAAIIDGQNVELGGRILDAKLIEVNSACVVLRTAQGRQVLKLFPDVAITSRRTEVSPVPAHKKVKSGEKK